MIAASVSPLQAEQTIFRTAAAQGLPVMLCKLITAQSGHETGGYTSLNWKRNNNGFGYGYNGQTYKHYDNVEDGVNDVIGWIRRRQSEGKFPADLGTITDAGTYAALLHNAGYYTDTVNNYTNGLQRYFNDNLALSGVVSVALVVGLGIAIYFFTRKRTR